MQAVIMAGGRGQRLHPLTLRRPKPLVPFFGQPLLGRLLQTLPAQGIDEVFITAGYLAEQISAYVRPLAFPAPSAREASPAWASDADGQRHPAMNATGRAPRASLRVHVHVERQPRGTAGAVVDLLPYLRSPFAVLSGDAVLDIDLEALRAAHTAAGHAATICLAPCGERLRFGAVALEGCRIQRFLEKPALQDLIPGLGINTGCYILEREALLGLPNGGVVDFALDVFPRLLRQGQPLGAYPAARYWRDIGTVEAYRETHFEGLEGHLPWPVPASHPPACRGAGVQISGPVHFGDGVILEQDAQVLGPAILGDGCRVGAGAVVSRSVLLRGSRIGRGANLRDAVLDEDSLIPPGLHLGQAAIGGCVRPVVVAPSAWRTAPLRRPAKRHPAPLPSSAPAVATPQAREPLPSITGP